MPRRYVSQTIERMDRMIDRLDAQRSVPKAQQPAYFRLVYAVMAQITADFLHCEPGEYWYDTHQGRFDCQFTASFRPRHMLVTFDRDERSNNRFVLSPAWFETDGRTGTPVRVDVDKLRRAFQGWLKAKSQPAVRVSRYDDDDDRPQRRPVTQKLRGGI